MIEDVPAQVRGDPLADPRHVVEAHVRRDRHHGDDPEQHDERLVERVRIVGAEAAIDDELESLPHRERATGCDQQRNARHDEAPPIRAEEAREPRDGPENRALRRGVSRRAHRGSAAGGEAL